MNHLTSRELLYLEDISKLFESIAKNCDFAANNAVDTQFKSYLQSTAGEHRQWITATASIINSNKLQ